MHSCMFRAGVVLLVNAVGDIGTLVKNDSTSSEAMLPVALLFLRMSRKSDVDCRA